MADQKQKTLLQVLSDGQVHSGEALGRVLGITRAAVWKQLGKIEAMGVALERVHGRGYRLATPVELLDEGRIHAGLSPEARRLLGNLQVLDAVDSTNAVLLRGAAAGPAAARVVLAESQSAGRGRRGRPWVSPYAANLYLSIAWHYAAGTSRLDGLSLMAGLVVLEALAGMGVPGLALKWPNDIVAADGKLGGVLVEMTGDPMGDCQVVIGIGINVAMPAGLAGAISQPWVDIRCLLGQPLSRNRLAAAVLNRLLPALAGYERDGFSAYRERWQQHDASAGRTVTLWVGERMVEGVGSGVDDRGAFLLQHDGRLQSFAVGEISLRMPA